jgi:hypothetical protein
MSTTRVLTVPLATVIGLTTVASAIAAEKQPQSPLVRVAVDPRVELFSIIFHQAGNPEYNLGGVESYIKDVDAHFGPFRNHPVVELAKKLRETRGIGFDAPMSMAVHLTDAIRLETRVPLNPWPALLDHRWTETDAQEFLQAARKFVRDTSYQEFCEQHRPLYAVAESRIRALLEKEAHWEWFGDFFGQRSSGSFTMTLGMLNGGCCYGVSCRTADGKKDLYCVLGVWKTDSQRQPEFTADMLPTIIHEFCHSHSNEFVDRHASELQAAGEKLFAPVASAMKSQAYDAKALLYESMVRACVVRYLHRYAGPEAAQKEVDEQNSRAFLWVGELSELLKQYESHRDQYPTLEAFAPAIIRFFNEYADKVDKQYAREREEQERRYQREREESEKIRTAVFAAEQKKPRPELKALDGSPPKIVSIVPADGDRNVDPNLKAIVVVFDRPMQDQTWAFVGVPDPPSPRGIGECAYDSSRSIWVQPVKLEPDKEYSFMLNARGMMAFKSRDGVPLEPVKVTFRTAPGSQADHRQ